MTKQYKKDIITCYESTWEIYGELPTVELILETYKEANSEDVANYAMDFYNDIGCYDEAKRVNEFGLADIDYDRVGFEEDLCATDIDIVLEESNYTFKRHSKEIVNNSQIYLFGEEW